MKGSSNLLKKAITGISFTVIGYQLSIDQPISLKNSRAVWINADFQFVIIDNLQFNSNLLNSHALVYPLNAEDYKA